VISRTKLVQKVFKLMTTLMSGNVREQKELRKYKGAGMRWY